MCDTNGLNNIFKRPKSRTTIKVFFAQLWSVFNAESSKHLFIPVEWENRITLPFQCFINVLSCLRNRSVTWAPPCLQLFCNTFFPSHSLSVSISPFLSFLHRFIYPHYFSNFHCLPRTPFFSVTFFLFLHFSVTLSPNLFLYFSVSL